MNELVPEIQAEGQRLNEASERWGLNLTEPYRGSRRPYGPFLDGELRDFGALGWAVRNIERLDLWTQAV